MVKRVCAIVIAASFLVSALPLMAGATQPSFLQQTFMKQRIEGLQQQLNVEDPSGLNAITIQFLDELLTAGLQNNKAGLQLAVLRYVSDVKQIQEALQIDNATICLFSFGMSAGGAAVGMITEVTSGNSAFCMVNNLSNKAVDILMANCTYQLCLIDKAVPGAPTDRDTYVQQKRALAIYNFATSAVNTFVCTASPTVGTYISFIFDFIGIFTIK